MAEIESEKRQLEHHFRQVQKMEALGALAGGIAHDFNNILTVILGYVGLAIEDADGNPSMVDQLEAVHAAALRAKDLVNQILTFARQTEQKSQPVQISLIAKETVKMLRSTIPPSISIQEDLKCDVQVMADPSQLHQVLMNLCTNAIHSMEEGEGVLGIRLSICQLDHAIGQKQDKIQPGEYARLEIAEKSRLTAPEHSVFIP